MVNKTNKQNKNKDRYFKIFTSTASMIPIVHNISCAVTCQVIKRFRQHLLVKGICFLNRVRIDTYT